MLESIKLVKGVQFNKKNYANHSLYNTTIIHQLINFWSDSLIPLLEGEKRVDPDCEINI